MGSITQVVYISQAYDSFKESDLDDLVSVSRHNNHKYGITGAMLFLENAFIQVVEGEEIAVGHLLDKLYADKRHHDIRIISDQKVATRNFRNWSMGVVSPPEEDKTQVLQEIQLVKQSGESARDLNLMMPVCQTLMMMRRLYDVNSVLQRARGNLPARP